MATQVVPRKITIVGGGFQKFNPESGCNQDILGLDEAEVRSNQLNTHQYKIFVHQLKPYHLFMTLAFGLNVSMPGRVKFTKDFIKYHNKMVFGRKYYEGDDYMEGFAFFEEHPSRVFQNLFHVHMLVKPNHKYAVWGFTAHEEIFRKAASKVLDLKGRNIFADDCIHIREAGDDGTIRYCFDQMWDGNLDNIKVIDRCGFVDNSLVVRRY